MDFKSLAAKKVAGVPVLYLAGAFVAILAIVAWKMKPAPSKDDGPVDETQAEDGDPTGGAADYSDKESMGTVTVVQGKPEPQEAVKQTNDDWERAAVNYLTDAKLATPTEAQNAIRKYLEGNDLTFEEGALKDKAILKLKLPPEPITTLGTVGNAPGQRQFSAFPGKHTVKGNNDNTPTKIAQLYYGSGVNTNVAEIVAANTSYGPAGTTYNPGTVITVPKWTGIRYYKTTKSTLWPSQVASKNGLSYAQIIALNPGKTAPYKLGEKIRVD